MGNYMKRNGTNWIELSSNVQTTMRLTCIIRGPLRYNNLMNRLWDGVSRP